MASKNVPLNNCDINTKLANKPKKKKKKEYCFYLQMV